MMDASGFSLTNIYHTDGIFTVKLNLSNPFGWVTDEVNITVQAVIHHVDLLGDANIALGDNVKYTAQGAYNMSGITYSWRITGTNYDVSNTTIDIPALDFTCPSIGLFHLFVEVNNEISSANTSKGVLCSETLSGVMFDIISQGMIPENGLIKVFKRNNVILNASITSDTSHISYTWNISGCGFSLIETTTNDSSLILTDLSPCVYDITLNVSNPIGSEQKTSVIDVIEIVKFGALTLLTHAVTTETVKFSLGLKRDGTRPCYTLNFGDGSPTQYLGTGCPAGTILNTDFVLDEKNITFSYDYESPGIFVLTITGKNDLSNDSSITKIPINLAPCKAVVAKVLGYGWDESKPRVEYKSRKTSIFSSVEVSNQ